MKKHVNIPVFIPHYGCPNDCVFCNQRKITGKKCYSREEVISEIETALSTINRTSTEVELAFFGGSFTAIPRDEMLGLLEVSDIFLKRGDIQSVRLSTRPDAINAEILDILRSHGVKTIELGLQSFSDRVLLASNRGHTASQSEAACKLIKSYGFELVGQMMIGLPSSTPDDEIMTAQTICQLCCDGVRIYPTVVFPDTALMRMKNEGLYVPLTNEDAIERTSKVIEVLAVHPIKIIRIGLCANETLAGGEFTDNYHPSIGELSLSRYYRNKMTALLTQEQPQKGSTAVFTVSMGKISQAVGQKRENVIHLKERFALKEIKVKEAYMPNAFSLSVDIH
jgi:histone acetyltransferase (RNA polymerase elongator complex component)